MSEAVYPNSLSELSGLAIQGRVTIHDIDSRAQSPSDTHQYALQPDRKHYVLFGVGPDGVSGTADDVFPVIAPEDEGHIGYVSR